MVLLAHHPGNGHYLDFGRGTQALGIKHTRGLLVHDLAYQGDSDLQVSVEDLALTLRSYMDHAGSNDLVRLFADLGDNVTWHTSPTKAIVPIARLEAFYTRMLDLCKNGMIPRRGLKLALMQVDADQYNHRSYRWNFASRSTADAAEQLGTTMRKGASKLRDLKMDAKLYSVAMSGASSECTTIIQKLLDCMSIDRETANGSPIGADIAEIFDDTGCRMDIFDKVMGRPLDMLALTDIETSTVRSSSPSESLTLLPPDGPADHHQRTTVSMMVPTRIFTSPGASIAQWIHETSPLDVDHETAINHPRTRAISHVAVPVRTPRKKIVRTYSGGSNSTTPTSSVKRSGKDPRRNYMCRAYRAAFKQAQADGCDEITSRSSAQIAYKAAGEQFVAFN